MNGQRRLRDIDFDNLLIGYLVSQAFGLYLGVLLSQWIWR